MLNHPVDLIPALDRLGYVVDEELATVLFVMLKLEKPLLLEGEPGVGKTEVAHILASYLNTDLIRLQCYEGLDAHHAIYDWNYQKQLLAIKLQEQTSLSLKEKESIIFGEDYLMKRPLLKAITSEKPVVLLIDEIDRADEEFEAFLLEILSAFQITIPEVGTIKAKHKPLVILTSNRTRDLSDALKRRCLYFWVPYPSIEKEIQIIKKHIPDVEEKLAGEIVQYVHKMRDLQLEKTPGVAETIDWVKGVMALNTNRVSDALSCVVKVRARCKPPQRTIICRKWPIVVD
ncbi:MAG: MoxR family ATPase [Saprospiraceae bacterium]|nr:MoxR family ATPase [Saprospiraceae bacterium]